MNIISPRFVLALVLIAWAHPGVTSRPDAPAPNERFFFIDGWSVTCWLNEANRRYDICRIWHREGPMTISLVVSNGSPRYLVRRGCELGGAMALVDEREVAPEFVESSVRQAVESIVNARCPASSISDAPPVPAYPEGFFRKAYEILLLMKSF